LPIEGDRAWEAKLALHRAARAGPDGHDTPPEAWVELERRKAEAGAFRPYLLVPGARRAPEHALGAVAYAPCGRLLRLKNLVVHPDHRRRGVGTAAVALGAQLAKSLGERTLGVFAIAGDIGERLYRRRGLQEIVRQTEWMRRT
jgi:GNAT superfamily N-acetyltransferase